MKQILSALFLLCSLTNYAQQSYFQQEVNYKIDVKLDDKNHILRAYETFDYINNSPDELREIYIHLWPNAYKNGETALAKQQYRDGDETLEFISEKDKGYIDSLDFKVNGEDVKLIFDEEHIDIAKLILNEALPAGGKITVSTPFRVKIPNAKISRLGHVDESYMITQWYPKPAVYDKNGWNPMPYLGQGEFYSEYGTFEVNITLPKNYVVGSTGDVQQQSELDWLDLKHAETMAKINANSFNTPKFGAKDKFPPSSTEFKTLTYKQKNVHDFAWFADKRYEVLVSEVELPNSKRKVKTYAMFTPKNGYLWQKASEYINDATYYYSLWNGDYPYNQVTAVDGTIAAGGGMEYPNVTVIGNTGDKNSLEIVIVHEVGHNWFYGILGSNERTHAWMDEGLNTLNEVRYVQTKYPQNTRLADMVMNGKFNFHGHDYHDMNDILVRSLSSLALDQPMETHSAEFTPINYGVTVYQKTGLAFDYLKSYFGKEKFDGIMQAYYEKWKFKHPQPKDIQDVFETISGEPLDWFFKDLVQTTNHIDYKLKTVKQGEGFIDVTVKNVGQIAGPIPVTLISKAGDTVTQWTNANTDEKTLRFNQSTVAEVVIDIDKQIPEINRSNNTFKESQLFNKIEPLKLNSLLSNNRRGENNISWLPFLGGNDYDKFMLGLTFHNLQTPVNKFSFFATPSYSFGRKMISGTGEFFYTILPKQNIEMAKIGLSVKSFKDDDVYQNNDSWYLAYNPYVSLDLGTRGPRNPFQHNILLQGMHKITKRGPTNIKENGGFAQYRMQYIMPDHQSEIKLRSEVVASNLDDQMGRVTLDAKYKYRYKKRKGDAWMEFRIFGGTNFLHNVNSGYNNDRYSLALAGRSGSQDIFMEEYYFGRNRQNGLWAQQRNEDLGGFKTVSSYGTTNSWLTSANVYIQSPVFGKLFGVYGDVGAFDQNGTTYAAFDAGLGLRFGEFLAVYFPVVQSQNLEDSFISKRYEQRIRFSLKLNVVNSGKLLNRLR